MLAASAPAVPTGTGFAFEPKWDGFRTLVKLDGTGRCRLVSRHGRVWTDAFPELGHIGRSITGPTVLDGETVVMGEDGRPSFEYLSVRLARERGPRRPATFVAFDVLILDGEPLVDRPWSERRQLLAGLEFDGQRAAATMVCDDGDALFAATGSLGVEGVVAKKRSGRYVCGRRTRSWLKIKHRGTGWFDLVGWRPPSRSRPGMVVLTEDGAYAGTAMVALPSPEHVALHRFIDRYGQVVGDRVWVPAGAQVRVEYTERSVRGLLREAAVRGLRPSFTD